MTIKERLALLLLAVVATLAIVWISPRGPALVLVTSTASRDSRGQLLDALDVSETDGVGVFFNFAARVSESNSERLFLFIRPVSRQDYQVQSKEGLVLQDGVVRGVAQLASGEWSLRSTERYKFELRDGAGTVFIDGDIVANSYNLAAPGGGVVAIVGVTASVIEILVFVRLALTRKREEKSPKSQRPADTSAS
jgi:hypothetical protein